MAEPTSTAAAGAAIIAGAATAQAITLLGVPLGLRTDVLMAGLSGSICAILLLNTVPLIENSFAGYLGVSVRRMGVALASSLTAGYIAPLLLLISSLPDSLMLSLSFVIGGGSQQLLAAAIGRLKVNLEAVK